MILQSDAKRLYLTLPYQYRHVAKGIPGYKWNGERNAWSWPKSVVSYINLRETFPKLDVDRDTAQ